jgi:hypothetical protein
MPVLTDRPTRFFALAGWLLAAAAAPAQGGQAAFAKLEALQASPESAGTLVYRGEAFVQRTPAGAPLYRYERRVLTAPNGLIASHITSDPAGRVIIVESALVSPHDETWRFEAVNQQSGFAGSVQISNGGRHLAYELNDNGKLSTASEDVSDPVVCGPSLFGFILKNWDPLMAGTSLPVRMLALKEKTTYGFDLKFDKVVNGQASFTITPGSFLIRMAVAPLRVVFDAGTRKVVRYEGRVPPMENVSGKLKDLDARVEYASTSPAYR